MRTLARSRRLQNRGSDPMNEAMRMLPPPLFFLRPGISQRVALLTASFLVWMHDSRAAETKAFTQPGIAEMRLVTDVDAIQAGKPFHIGLVIRHLPGYHTYWKNPGIVGVPTSFLWDLPPGFVAGEIQWPAPRTTQMAAYTAWGYEGDVCLVVEIRPPAKLPKTDAEGNLWLKARAIWMCCAVQCNPGWEDFQIPLVVARSDQKVARDEKNAGLIESSLAKVPGPGPTGWNYRGALPQKDLVELEIIPPAEVTDDLSGAWFFCDDNLADSHEPQKVRRTGRNSWIITMHRPPHAPKNPVALSGVLQLPGQKPEFRVISVPLP